MKIINEYGRKQIVDLEKIYREHKSYYIKNGVSYEMMAEWHHSCRLPLTCNPQTVTFPNGNSGIPEDNLYDNQTKILEDL